MLRRDKRGKKSLERVKNKSQAAAAAVAGTARGFLISQQL